MYEHLNDEQYWKIADRKISVLRLKPEDMQKVMAWRSTCDREQLRLWEIYDDVLLLRIKHEPKINELKQYKCTLDGYSYGAGTGYRLSPEPPRFDAFEDYVKAFRAEQDIKYFCFFLHHFEGAITKKANRFADRYALESYAEDLKSACAGALWFAFLYYDTNSEIPFLQYAQKYIYTALHETARSYGNNFTIKNGTHYYRLRKAAYLRQKLIDESCPDVIGEISRQMKLSEKQVTNLLEEVQARNNFVDFYYSDDPDDDSVAERIADPSPNPEVTIIRQMAGDVIDECLSHLDKRDTDLLEGIIGFCSECFANKKPLSYDELADLYQYTDEASIFRAYSKARERLIGHLVEEQYCHSIELKRLSLKTDKEKAVSVTYSYRPYAIGTAGEIQFDLVHDVRRAFLVIKLAEYDITGVFAYQTALAVFNMQKKEKAVDRTGDSREWKHNLDKVYYKNRLIAIPWDKMQNTVNSTNAIPNLPKHLILKLKKQDAGQLLFSYIPEGVEKEEDEVFAEGQISAELKDGKWCAQTVRLADLDLTRTTPYAKAAIKKIERLSTSNTRIPKQQKIWFIT